MTVPTAPAPALPPPPPPPPAPPRAAAPAAAVRIALLAGPAAALLLPGGPPGIGVPLLALVLLALLLPLAARTRPRGQGWRWRAVHAGAALLLAGGAAVRDATWVVALDLLAAAALASLALVPWRSATGVLRAMAWVGWNVPGSSGWLARGLHRDLAGADRAAAAPALRGVALAVGLLAVFVPLLVSADAAFGRLLDRLLPDLPSASGVAGRLLVFALAAVVAAAAAGVLLRSPAEPAVPPPGRLLDRTSEWLLPLGSLTLLLGGFVTVQAHLLFGQHDLVLSQAGLTYAEHTRSGFWQLLAVTALVLAVVAAAARWTPCGRGVRALLGALCLLALVIDASSLSRLRLYVEEYGLTRLRILVAATCVWLAVVLLAVLLAGAVRRRGWLPQAVVLSAAAVLLVLTAADPDARIARSALDRGDRADLAYLRTLSADAVPVLAELPVGDRACALAPHDAPHDARAEDAPWTSANLARREAQEVLSRLPAGPACGLPLLPR